MTSQTPLPWPLAFALRWIDLWRLLTPASRRTSWRDQWRADLWHYWLWLSREPLPQRSRTWRLAARAAAVPLHALSLRLSEWSLQMLANDLRLAWRLIVRRPAFTFVAVLILGLGIGANATIFSWVETILLKPLPGVAEQDRLVAIRGTTPTRNNLSYSYPNYLDLRNARPDGFEDLIAFRAVAMNLRADGGPVRVWGELVTPNFFDVLRVTPMLGRGFLPSEGETPGSAAVAVISESLWRRQFASDASIVGRPITLNGQSFSVIGVAPPGFHGSTAGLALDMFVPITMQKAIMSGDRLGLRGNSFLQVFGRLSAGSTMDRAQASASVVAARLAQQYPDTNKDRGALVVPLYRDGASNLLMPVVATLMAVVGIVLLIACANLAGLLLAKAAGRQREVAVRLAVGASRGRLVRQFLIEGALLAAAGGAAGIVISYWTSGMLTFFVPPTPFPVNFTAELSPTVLAFSVATTFATALVFGLLPALKASQTQSRRVVEGIGRDGRQRPLPRMAAAGAGRRPGRAVGAPAPGRRVVRAQLRARAARRSRILAANGFSCLARRPAQRLRRGPRDRVLPATAEADQRTAWRRNRIARDGHAARHRNRQRHGRAHRRISGKTRRGDQRGLQPRGSRLFRRDGCSSRARTRHRRA